VRGLPVRFNKLKYLFTSTLLVLSLDVSAVENTQQFNKAAYLDFSKPYTHNWNNSQPTTKKDNQTVILLKEVGGIVRNALGSSNSDNANQLGDKIAVGVKNQLKNKAINATEGLINDKANKFVNQFGSGRSEISIHQIESKNPTYSIKTIQPLSKLNSDSKDLTFFQGQLASGENHGERRNTINLGVGYRLLVEDDMAIAGANLFSDYETKSAHKRLGLGLEYQRSNFSTHINTYYPISNRKVIGDYTEEALAGYDIKLTGQMPYLPWAKIKGTRYYYDGKQGPNIKGTVLGVEIELTPSIDVELGIEKSNTADRTSYMRLAIQLPFKDNESFTNFSIDSKPFRNAGIVNLTDLSLVERSNKIRIEKVSRSGTSARKLVLGAYNATTTDASCILYNASDVAVDGGSGITTTSGMVSFLDIELSTKKSLYYSICTGGSYTDEATGQTVDPAPTLHAAKVYSGTGDLTIIASPLSEIAYQLADTAGDIASLIESKNDKVAKAFGIVDVDIITTMPTDLNIRVANNDGSGKFGLVLAAFSQVGENSSDASPEITITKLVSDINGTDGSYVNTIEGRNTGTETVDILTAIDNFKTSGGDNNSDNGVGSGNTGVAGSAKEEGSVTGNLSVIKISNYDGTNSNSAPRLQNYTDAGVNGVSAGNLVEVNVQLATATRDHSDTTAEIQTLVDSTPGAVSTADSALSASSTFVPIDGSTTITLQAKDGNGNSLRTGGLVVLMTSTGSATFSAVIDHGDGTYRATMTSTVMTGGFVSATIDGIDVVDKTSFVSFTGASNAARSTLSASSTSVPTDGSTTITLQAKDRYGRSLIAGGLTVLMTSTGSATLSAVIDNGDGTYGAVMTNTVLEDVTVSAAIDGNNVTNTLDVTFIAGAARTTQSTLSASPMTVPADGVTPITITLQAKDAHGNHLTTGGSVVLMTSTGSARGCKLNCVNP
jgi:hypothetical protein